MSTFNATNKDISQAERIRRQYLDKELNKMEQLKSLDDKVKAPGKIVASVLDVISALVTKMKKVVVESTLTSCLIPLMKRN